MLRLFVMVLLGMTFLKSANAEEANYPAVEPILKTSATILDQPLVYPMTGAAEVTAVIVTLKPGEKTSSHLHEVPLFGYVLQGELTVYYEHHGTKLYKTGDALMEAEDIWHIGENTGEVPMRILAVFMGAKGAKNSVTKE